ncbi:hypothetical protein Drorol1_Dr00000173 [Drosera rotundifolia]
MEDKDNGGNYQRGNASPKIVTVTDEDEVVCKDLGVRVLKWEWERRREEETEGKRELGGEGGGGGYGGVLCGGDEARRGEGEEAWRNSAREKEKGVLVGRRGTLWRVGFGQIEGLRCVAAGIVNFIEDAVVFSCDGEVGAQYSAVPFSYGNTIGSSDQKNAEAESESSYFGPSFPLC